MFVRQISVFLENSTGTLAALTELLAENKIDLIALSIADTEHYGILRAIVKDTDRAAAIIKNAGYTVKLTDVLAVSVPDVPGGLSGVLAALSKAEVSVHYIYSFVRQSAGRALIILRVSDMAKSVETMEALQIPIFSHEQVSQL